MPRFCTRKLAAPAAAALMVLGGLNVIAADVPKAAAQPPAAKKKAHPRLSPAPLQAKIENAVKSQTIFSNPVEPGPKDVYDLTLTYRDFASKNGPDHGVPSVFRLLCYNESPCGPTIRVRRGSTLRIHLKNGLARNAPSFLPDPSTYVQAPYDKAEQPHGLNVTNLHTHGLHVSPADPSDNILRCIGPQETHDFTFTIPADHPSGTFWYHPHKHGSVAYQLSNGVAGALIVEGTENDGIHDLDDIPEIGNARERILVFQLYNFRARSGSCDPTQPGVGAVGWIDASTIYNVQLDSVRCGDIKIAPEDVGPANTVSHQLTAINGLVNPTITFAPGEVQRWRLVHAGWDLLRRFAIVDDSGKQVPDFKFKVIAYDGLATGDESAPTTFETDYVELAPGQRADVLIQAPTPAQGAKPQTYHLKQLDIAPAAAPRSAPQDPMFVGMIQVTDPVQSDMSTSFPPRGSLARCRPFSDIKPAEVTVRRKPFVFAAADGTVNLDGNQQLANGVQSDGYYTISGKSFHDQEPLQLSLNTAEEWTLTAESGGGSHPFHIHVNPFQVVSHTRPGEAPKPMNVWRDTLYLQDGETYVIRHRFLDFTGRTVLHCHILDHEDQGMMFPLTLVDQGRPLPPQQICDELKMSAMGLSEASVPAPALALRDVRGGLWSLDRARQGNLVLVFFQGIECAHCASQLRNLIRDLRQREPGGPATRVVAVSSRKIANPSAALKRLELEPTDDVTLLVDEPQRTFRNYSCYQDGPLHGLFLVDAAGVIRARYVGKVPFDDTRQVVRRLVEMSRSYRSASR